MFSPSLLFAAPEVNPVTHKARSIPIFNVVNMYGRVFFFSWFGFFVAFWSWYAFPPLLHDTIQKDLSLTKVDIANSNIIALCATLLVRLIAGPCCDRFGARSTFAALLLLGAIPTFLAGTCYTRAQLFACRFFVGILGGAFVPCQVWSTGFFDKNVVGTANALIGGWGNAGGGVTYFLMPSIYDSLVNSRGYSPHVAWRIAFVVPGIVITATALGLFFLCEDTPTGKWADRHVIMAEKTLQADGVEAVNSTSNMASSDKAMVFEDDIVNETKARRRSDGDGGEQMVDTAHGEMVTRPTPMQTLRVVATPQVLVLALCYVFSFGAELAINSILSAYYEKQFSQLNQTTAGQWAAMFGLLNVVTRPLGGIVADMLYRHVPDSGDGNNKVWAKKLWLHFTGLSAGAMLMAIGLAKPTREAAAFGLVAGFACVLEAGNGANFALVPHVIPAANGVVSGFTGAAGNLGGILFSIVFRYEGTTRYHTAMLITGAIGLGLNVLLLPLAPLPRRQRGGR